MRNQGLISGSLTPEHHIDSHTMSGVLSTAPRSRPAWPPTPQAPAIGSPRRGQIRFSLTSPHRQGLYGLYTWMFMPADPAVPEHSSGTALSPRFGATVRSATNAPLPVPCGSRTLSPLDSIVNRCDLFDHCLPIVVS